MDKYLEDQKTYRAETDKRIALLVAHAAGNEAEVARLGKVVAEVMERIEAYSVDDQVLTD